MRVLVIFLSLLLSACGHSHVSYAPVAPVSMSWERAVSIVEQGFYEDYGEQRPQSVEITNEAIVLADGLKTTANSFGTVLPGGGIATVVGSSSVKTVAEGQRLYFRSLGPSMVYKKNARDNRYAVIMRMSVGATARRVFFRSEASAKQFADAVEYLRLNAPMQPAQ